MLKIIAASEINVPIDLIFDFERSVDLHIYTQSYRNEAVKSALESDIWKSYLDQLSFCTSNVIILNV